MAERLSGVSEFVAVVETSGFTAAASRLGLSRSAVGKTVARLESRLGVRLFHRTTRTVSLTEDGQAFYERCARALAELEAAEAALDSGCREPAGRLRISVPVLFGRRCVAPVLLDVARRHPRLELEVSFTDRPVDLIDEGVDLAVRNGAPPDVAGLMARKLARQRMTVCASPAYLEPRGRPSSIADLAEHEAIAYARAGRSQPWLFPDRNGRPSEVPIRSRISLDDLEAIADAATAGMGIAWLPCWLIRERVHAGALVRLLLDAEPVAFDSFALWPRAPHTPARLRVVIDALAASLPGVTG
jgi:DNA-binding transcriptional LysR family regulator